MPPPPAGRNGAATTRNSRRDFAVSSGVVTKAQKVVIYGPGGVGKTELTSLLEKCGVRTLIMDLEQGSHYLSANRLDTLSTWDDLRDALHSDDLLKDFGAVCIDSFTKAEEMAEAWTVANVPHEKGSMISSLEDYGWGKGYGHLYDTFLHLLSDLDALARKGKHVIGICHDCTAKVPNPMGEDWIRYEPRLQSPGSGNNSIRHRVKEWADHLFFIGFDSTVSKDGKAQGHGSRTIYPTELPTWWAKSRSLANPIEYRKGDPQLWNQLLSK